ncbi:V-type immunoglobulin domain-containing suppressor of T-cell activation isoform X1 [Rhincodon typus]|uniref:V-type immunoglobulin domain-containing suppressor of T-cell activation isoform X1 n=2 Tax=Rhincodon typus TaxID=259920 RepID=UPI00202F368F|nr:V-type immunoglobulin domain-containing suppressor of T-cell activation isoform X1 [Rhincodon typus]
MDLQGNISSRLLVWTVILLVNTVTQAQATVLKVSSDHMVYMCPEGVNVTFNCSLSGHLKNRHDSLAKLWYYSRSKNALCKERMHIRNTTVMWENHNPNKGRGVYMNSNHQGVFWVSLSNLVPDDEGVYCCVVHELHRSQPNAHHPKVELTVYGTMELQVIPGNGTHTSNQKCTFRDPTVISDSEATTAAALATMGCVIGILSLPLILLLIYKQRQGAATRRRAHELVRMDSEAIGVENPVFEEITAQNSEVKPRTLDIRRLPSDSDRHLLSEPNTPLSPEALPRFFPTLELVPDSPK